MVPSLIHLGKELLYGKQGQAPKGYACGSRSTCSIILEYKEALDIP